MTKNKLKKEVALTMAATKRPLAVQIVIEQDIDGNSAIGVTYGEIRVDQVVKLLSKSIIDHIEMHDTDIVPEDSVEIVFDELDLKMDVTGVLSGIKVGDKTLVSKDWADKRDEYRNNYIENQKQAEA